ncbi:MAG: hypothetical protein EXR65_00935 [Dehalococcoidia bacterium]|nr:hypothetical protein [Dehalococcoidia bacterium]
MPRGHRGGGLGVGGAVGRHDAAARARRVRARRAAGASAGGRWHAPHRTGARVPARGRDRRAADGAHQRGAARRARRHRADRARPRVACAGRRGGERSHHDRLPGERGRVSAPPQVPAVTRLLDRARVGAYAGAARDGNPIHLDPVVARAAGLDGPLAHGMLVLALVSEAMSRAFGRRWADSGSLKVRWRAPALVPSVVTARAVLRSERDGVASYDVRCEDARGVVLLNGTASARYR